MSTLFQILYANLLPVLDASDCGLCEDCVQQWMDIKNTCLLCSIDTTFMLQTHWRGFDNALKL